VLRPEDLPRFSECFVTSTTQDVVPVAVIGAQRFELGPSTFTRRLKKAFQAYVSEYEKLHLEWRV
jgi:branched-subunit amino acid aminotransferase/4-amino-4-deoxychorismate lyase